MESDEELAARRIGQTVGRYRLERVIGVGGMAAVYAARSGDGAVAALKILHPEMSVRRDIRERFFREGYVANSIQHPGAVRALEHGEAADGGVFLALELLNGETLTQRLKRHGALPVAELLDYADQVLDVLVIAHGLGIVHRDLKPDNLFVTHEGRIKILDFGLARLAESAPGDSRTRSGVALGTLPYMAPEQALGRRDEVDHRVDVFAVGATLFRLLSGRKIHEANSEAELLMAMASKPAPPLRAVAPSVPEEIARVVDLALAFSRDARYPDARSMQADVRAVRAGQPPPIASARFAVREEKTRTEPLGGPPPSAGPKSTVPLHVYMASAPQNLGATFSPAQNPISPMPRVAPTAEAGHRVAAAVPQGAPAPTAEKRRPGVGRWVALGVGAVVLTGGAAAALAVAFDGSEPPHATTSSGAVAPSAASAVRLMPAPQTTSALARAEAARADTPSPASPPPHDVGTVAPKVAAARPKTAAAPAGANTADARPPARTAPSGTAPSGTAPAGAPPTGAEPSAPVELAPAAPVPETAKVAAEAEAAPAEPNAAVHAEGASAAAPAPKALPAPESARKRRRKKAD